MKTLNWVWSSMVCCTLALFSTSAATLYVWQGSLSPAPPFTNWSTAALTIQEAVDAAQPGDTVVVTNGIYAKGGKAVYGTMTNRVAVEKPITLRSVNGPEFTIIEGYQVPGTTNGDGAIRCVYLTNWAELSGFTLTKGATRSDGDYDRERDGGGVWCKSTNAVVTNCTLTGNSSAHGGGGSRQGTLDNCFLKENTASLEGGGAFGGTLSRCTLIGNAARYGGGAMFAALNHCTLTSNWASWDGGGAMYGTLSICALSGNSATNGGGGSYMSVLNNCTLTGNWALSDGGGARGGRLDTCTLTGNSASCGGGAFDSTLNHCTLTGNSAYSDGGGASGGALTNCIVYFNTATNSPNHDHRTILNYCCTTPLPTNGIGNITNAPPFADLAGGNLRLQTNSPCINAGNNSCVTISTDLDGKPRIVNGTVDIGAYEYQGAGSVISYAWLQQHGLPTDGSVDSVDPDHDGQNTRQEWQADTDPTNAASCLRLSITSNGPPLPVTFSSSAARLYTLLCCTNLSSSSVWPPVPGQTDIPGTGGVLTLTDTNPPAPAFYRVSVRFP